MDVESLLKSVRSGETSVEQAAERLRMLPYENIDFARIDHHRKLRTSCAEVIFCQGKTPEQAAQIFERLRRQGGNVLATRADGHHAAAILALCPDAAYHERARVALLRQGERPEPGRVAVCTGGTADEPVAEEAALTAEVFGARVDRFYDVGISGLHRVLDVLPQIWESSAIVAAAGMEGALPSVLAGLVDKPVIAVPTSVGYGAHFGGLAPLLTMINSCAAGVACVNIDNGFGAGYLAAQIARSAVGGSRTQTE